MNKTTAKGKHASRTTTETRCQHELLVHHKKTVFKGTDARADAFDHGAKEFFYLLGQKSSSKGGAPEVYMPCCSSTALSRHRRR